MAKMVKQKHGGALKMLQKGETANPNGRPRKYLTTLRAQGYKRSEINDTLQVLLSMTVAELKQAHDSPEATVLEKTLIKAMFSDIAKGRTWTVDSILDRAFGKATQKTDLTTGGEKINVPIIEWVKDQNQPNQTNHEKSSKKSSAKKGSSKKSK